MEVLKWIFAVFALIGAADKLTGDHLGLGKQFEKGFGSAGTLALAMIGMICLSPVIARGMTVALSGFCDAVGIDPSFAGGFMPNDMGGAAVARELAKDPVLGSFNGLVVSTMLGGTLCFTVPVAMQATKKENHEDLFTGLMCGVATFPVGCIAAGLVMGIAPGPLFLNLSPALGASLLTCLGLIFNPRLCCKIFAVIGKAVSALIVVGLALGILDALTGVRPFESMVSVKEAFGTVAEIAVILAGVFPMIALLERILKKPFAAAGRKLAVNERSVSGLLASVANSIPALTGLDEMDSRGRILNMAFSVSGAFILGDHLAFTAAFEEKTLGAVILGKAVSAAAALIAAVIVINKKRSAKVSDTHKETQ